MTDTPIADAPPIPDLPRDATQDGPAVRLYLVDGSGFIFRAFHALPPLTRKSDGLPIGAVSGFCNMLWKLLVDMKAQTDAPTHLAVVFDHSEKTFRNALYDKYKAHRPPPPEDLVPQFPLVRDATRAFGVPCLELPGYEADDIIAAYACKVRDMGGEVRIVSSDKDLMQLVGDRVSMLDTMKNLLIGPEQVMEKFGVPPDKVVDVQALCGDSVDNVPGAPGIGIKTAALLINEYGDLDTLLARAGEIKQDKRRQTLIDFADQIRLSRQLVQLDCDTPLPSPIDDLVVAEPTAEVLAAFLEEMGLHTLGRRVASGGGGTRAPAAPTAPAPRPAAVTDHGPIDVTKYVCVRDLETLDAWIAKAHATGVIAFDTETDALSSSNANLCGISLAIAPGEACYIPVGHEHEGGLEFDAPADLTQIPHDEVIARLKPLLEDPSVLKVAQNAKYDLGVLTRHGIDVAPIDDTMLISYVLEAGIHKSHGMDELSNRLLEHTPIPFKQVTGTGKAQKSFKHVPLEPATCYAAEDADVTLRLYLILRPRLQAEGLLTVYETLERPMPPVLAQMENAGIRVDPDQLARLSHDFSIRMTELEAQAYELAGRPFNLGSPKQIGEVLYGEMGLASKKTTATGAQGTDASILEDLAAQGHALPRVLLDWRQLSKLKGTYTDNLAAAIAPRTGRVHTSYALASTTTGRLSSNDPNLQNIPVRTEEGRKIRKAFIAEPGKLLISADYSQIELRLLAHVGDIPQLKKAFLEGQDIHAATASEMFGVPIEGMPAETRRRAKAINFGIVYGISAFGLANQLSIPQDEAGAYIKTYFERFPGIRTYMDRAKQAARSQGFVSTIFGRKVNIPAVYSKSQAERAFGDRAAINAPLQGAAADIIRPRHDPHAAALKQAGLEGRMLLQVHDELVFEAPEAEADALIKVAKQVMEHAAEPVVALSVPLVVDAPGRQELGRRPLAEAAIWASNFPRGVRAAISKTRNFAPFSARGEAHDQVQVGPAGRDALHCAAERVHRPDRAGGLCPPPGATEEFAVLRDGTRLAANVFKPQGTGPWPVVLSRTPYLKDGRGKPEELAAQARKYTDAGYVFVLQDVRGKGHSQGFYQAYATDIEDGYDSVEWAAKQSWSNGKVGITGASALGVTANAAAMANPPHLRAAYVVVAPYDRLHYTFPGGVIKEKDTVGWLKGQGVSDAEIDETRVRATDDVFWNRFAMSANRKYIAVPIYNVGGWYDIFNQGNTSNFEYLQNQGAKGARGNQKLMMGPFGHGPLSGDLAYPGQDQLQGAFGNELRWFDYWLKGIDNGIMDEPPVSYFMMAGARKGAISPKNRMMTSANWPPANREVRYYLTPDKSLTTKAPAAADAKLSYRFDPANPVATFGGANLTFDRGPEDQRQVPARQDYLRFQTPVLDKDVAIAGPVKVELYGATDGPDTDFMAKLVDVYPDGYEALVLDAPIRARYRNGRMPDEVKMMTPGAPEAMTIDLWSTAITFEKGHRIAVHITSSNAPRFEVNPNTGEAPGQHTMKPRVALNSVYMDASHPSALVLPVIYPEAK